MPAWHPRTELYLAKLHLFAVWGATPPVAIVASHLHDVVSFVPDKHLLPIAYASALRAIYTMMLL